MEQKYICTFLCLVFLPHSVPDKPTAPSKTPGYRRMQRQLLISKTYIERLMKRLPQKKSSPSQEPPSEPDVSQDLPTEGTPSQPDVSQDLPTGGTPSQPDVSQDLPTGGTPSQPDVSQDPPTEGTPSQPDVSQDLPTGGTPSQPDVSQDLPTGGTPSQPDVSQYIPAEETTKRTFGSPYTEAIKVAEKLNVTPTDTRVKELLVLTTAVEKVRDAPLQIKKKLFAENAETTKEVRQKRWGMIGALAHRVDIPRKSLFHSKVPARLRQEEREKRKERVVEFLKREDNSYTLAGKRDQVRGQRKYALSDTMGNLHRKYCNENPSESMSKATFCRFRPKYMALSMFTQRRICLCERHTNIALLAEATKVLPRSTGDLIEMKDEDIENLFGLSMEDGVEISYLQWEKETIEYQGKRSQKIKLKKKKANKHVFIRKIISLLPDFRMHCIRVQTQHEDVRRLRSNLYVDKEATVQVDYAENFQAKLMDEVASAYYDKSQVTLHPMVAHVKTENEDGKEVLEVISFVGISEVTNHSFPTTYTFLKKMVTLLKGKKPTIEVIHLISDSASSQYRNKSVCHFVANSRELLNVTTTWRGGRLAWKRPV